ncbi:MAG: hypothetical protein PHH77_08305 [Victivallaceae bacterium]|nr:hypothetical protein [Victivallaceae bacterium]
MLKNLKLREKELEQASSILNELTRQQKEYFRYKNLPWFARAKLIVRGKALRNPVGLPQAEEQVNQLQNTRNDIRLRLNRLSEPEFGRQKRYPLLLSKRVIAWFRHKFTKKRVLFTTTDRKLLELAQVPSERLFMNWLTDRKPKWQQKLLPHIWPQVNYLKVWNRLAKVPQTESQYKLFRRVENRLLETAGLAYSQIFEQERKRLEREVLEQQRLVRERARQKLTVIKSEKAKLAELKKRPDALLDPELLKRVFSYGQRVDWDDLQEAEKNATQEFIDSCGFQMCRETDLNKMPVPPMLNIAEMKKWLLSRTNAFLLDNLLRISGERQDEMVQQEEQKRAAAALQDERRENPMPEAQRRVLEKLCQRGLLDEVPEGISRREASDLINELLADEPVTTGQLKIIRKYIRDGYLAAMSEEQFASLSQGDYMEFVEQVRKCQEKKSLTRQNGEGDYPKKEQKLNRGMDI